MLIFIIMLSKKISASAQITAPILGQNLRQALF